MANFYYSYDEPSMLPKKEGHGRSIIIFIVILLLTVGIVYLIVPKDSTDEEKKNEPAPQEKTENSSEKNATDPDGKKSNLASEITSAAETVKKEVVKDLADSPIAPGNGATTDPVKGVPWKNDPAPEKDIPEKPVSAADLQAENALTTKNWQMVESKDAQWCVTHTIVRGDTLERIARKYHTTVSALKELNNLKSDTVFLGKKLTVVPGPWKIEVSKASRRLYLRNTSGKEVRTFGVYDIGIGRAGRTPSADFVISIRLRNPDYIAPDGGVFAYNTPGNPLGDYFLKLAQPEKADRPLAGYGIHGTADDSDVGRSISHGCIRMRNADVRVLYLLCPVGTPVHVAE